MTRLRWVGMILAAVTLATGAGVLTFGASGSQDQVLPTRQPSQPEGGVGSAAGPVRSCRRPALGPIASGPEGV